MSELLVRSQSRAAHLVVAMVGVAILAAACGSSTSEAGDAALPTSEHQIDAARCEANRDAGTITFVTSFDYSASANILGPIVANAEGYFGSVCLDVTIQPGFAPGNAALVAGGRAQMGSGGSIGELLNNNVVGESDLVAVAVYGHTAIEQIIVPGDSDLRDLKDLVGATIGIKGDIPYSIQMMFGMNGVERSSMDEVLLEGFDPVTHLDLGIDVLPVYKSNEPRQLDIAGRQYRVFDPLDYDVPASFGVQFTSRSFLTDHRTAVEDFVLASFRGFQFGLDHPREAVTHAIDLVQAADGSLTFDGELYRWQSESQIVLDATPPGEGFGLVDVSRVQAEAEALTRIGVFETVPDFFLMIDAEIAESAWQGTTLRWAS